MNARRVILRAVEASALCLAPLPASLAADADDIVELKRAVEALREENRALAKRIATLEGEQAGREREQQPKRRGRRRHRR